MGLSAACPLLKRGAEKKFASRILISFLFALKTSSFTCLLSKSFFHRKWSIPKLAFSPPLQFQSVCYSSISWYNCEWFHGWLICFVLNWIYLLYFELQGILVWWGISPIKNFYQLSQSVSFCNDNAIESEAKERPLQNCKVAIKGHLLSFSRQKWS